MNKPQHKYSWSILNFWLIVFCLSLLNLPVAFGFRDNLAYRYFGIIPYISGLILLISRILRSKEKSQKNHLLFALLVLLAITWLIAGVRTLSSEFDTDSVFTIEQLSAFFIVFLFIYFSFSSSPTDDRLLLQKGVLYSLGLYTTLNFALFFFGINQTDQIYLAKYPSQMLSIIGIKTYRVLFPMASSINTYGVLTGAAFIGSFFYLKNSKTLFEKIIVGIILVSAFLQIFLTDTRGALLFSIFTVALVILPKKLFKYARWIPFLISILLPITFFLFPNLLDNQISVLDRSISEWNAEKTSSYVDQCKTYNESTSGFLSNRTVIWNYAFKTLQNFRPIQIIGYGFRGQIQSGLSSQFMCLFSSYELRQFVSLHNAWLQLVFDIGYIGLLITLITLIIMVKILDDQRTTNPNGTTLPFLAIILYVVSSGTLETTLYPDALILFGIVIMILTSMVFPTKDCPANAKEDGENDKIR